MKKPRTRSKDRKEAIDDVVAHARDHLEDDEAAQVIVCQGPPACDYDGSDDPDMARPRECLMCDRYIVQGGQMTRVGGTA